MSAPTAVLFAWALIGSACAVVALLWTLADERAERFADYRWRQASRRCGS